MLGSSVYHLGECKFNANYFVIGNNHENSSALNKDSITFSETSVPVICI